MAIRSKRKAIEHRTEQDAERVSDRYPFRYELDTGDRGALVLWAQSKLAEQGYYSGPLDGKYNRELTLAVRKFQDQRRFAVTGVINRRTWEAL